MKNFNYKVKVKNGAGWRAFKTARLQISVGGERHEDSKFLATVQWAEQNFDKVLLCVNDTLQRYNLMNEGLSEAEAYKRSLSLGDEWLQRNMPAINRLSNFELYRWDDWIDNEFTDRYQTVIDRYNTDVEFYEAVQDSQKNALSISYILEEVAVFSLMYEKEDAVDVYPGTLPKAMYVFSDQHQTRIDFARISA